MKEKDARIIKGTVHEYLPVNAKEIDYSVARANAEKKVLKMEGGKVERISNVAGQLIFIVYER